MKIKFKKLLFVSASLLASTTPLIANSCFYANDPSILFAENYIKNNPIFNSSENEFKTENPKVKEFIEKIKQIRRFSFSGVFYNYEFLNNIVIDFDSQEELKQTLPEIKAAFEHYYKNTPMMFYYLFNKQNYTFSASTDAFLTINMTSLTYSLQDYKSSTQEKKNDNTSDKSEDEDKGKDENKNKDTKKTATQSTQGGLIAIPYNISYLNLFLDITSNKFGSQELNNTFNNYLKLYNQLRSLYLNVKPITDNNKPEGIFKAFAPIYLLKGVSIDGIGAEGATKQNNAYKIFAKPMDINDPDIIKAFNDSPIGFFENNLDLMFFSSLITLKKELDKTLNDYNNQIEYYDYSERTEFDKLELEEKKEKYEQVKFKYDQKLQEKDEFIAKFKQVQEAKLKFLKAREELKISTSAELESKVEQLKMEFETREEEFAPIKAIFQKDIDANIAKITKQLDANHGSLELYVLMISKYLYGANFEKVQVIRGKKDGTQEYGAWLEYWDKEQNKWFVLDVYKDYLNKSQSDYTPQPQETIPSGYTILEEFKPFANIKN
ncbi:hypothetical protein V2E24_00235 [Mycoplasmopsis ciconiae]|uniref:Lipoprotein n=1 Tax=Mycoplasmopsis ciconiae TaxID=561067 RepID=A0ABU7MKE7_9BACT|nr:hypothetical protein [Mycoplasmopsis ciconiae]